MLDDVDRLAHDEIRLLFQLIKANADFPNIIYLVLAQRETVVKALEHIAPGQGDAFLEKIVQVGFNVPQIGRRQLEQILFAGLNLFLADDVVGQRFDKEHWETLYREGVEHFFRNLRDVKRYLSSLGFHVGVFRSPTSFEVNLADLIAIETLRVFVPELYDALSGAKHILTDQPRFMRKEEQEQDAAALRNILTFAPEEHREAARSIIKELFPPAARLLAGSYYGQGGDNWFPDLRIASHKVFDRYFHFATPPGDLAQAELDQVITLVGSREALGAKLKDLESRGLLDVLLDRLNSYKDRLPLEHVLPCVTSLFDLEVNGDDDYFAGYFSPRTHIIQFVLGYLRREPDQSKRKEILLKAIEQSSGLTTPVSMVTNLEARATASQPLDPDALLQNACDIDEVRLTAVAKIRTAAESGRLANEKEMGSLLEIWNAWEPGEGAKEFTVGLAQSDAGLLRVLAAARNNARRYGGPISSNIETFLLVKEVLDRIEALDPKALSEEDAKNVAWFKGVMRKKRGLGEFDPHERG